MSFQERIDVHTHFLPPDYRTALEDSGNHKPDGMPGIPRWSEESHLELMKDLSITKSIVSISSPGTDLTPSKELSCRKLTRDCNNFAGDLVRRRPKEFGFWASLPIPDIPAALEEIAYALDELHADGFTLHTNHHGIYLGDPTLDPIFDELNRRKATIFIHPTMPCTKSCNGAGPQPAVALPQIPIPMYEFLFDTARAVINLFLSGTVARCPNIKFILSHAGGALPPIIERFSGFTVDVLRNERALSSKIIKETMARQFYFDLAGFVFPDQIHGLLRFVDDTRLLYGSDFPFTPTKSIHMLAGAMTAGMDEVFPSSDVQRRILVGNAQKLLGLTAPAEN